MSLTQTQLSTVERVKSSGSGGLSINLNNDICTYILAVIVRDLGLLSEFSELPDDFPEFFSSQDLDELKIEGYEFYSLLEKLVNLVQDADMYFACLGTLHKSRLKYKKIIEYQPLPTMDQVGPRSLLQYGQMSSKVLSGFLLWRKWLYDIDNRAGQETGYLFEPIIANAIGGSPVSANKSPIRRARNSSQGRQIDCIKKDKAYEIKLRVTIAASGQGRWREELEFPVDAKASGYDPILIVLDPTTNPKLDELVNAFEENGGTCYVGDNAWLHLEEAAGDTMSIFLDKYVKNPILDVLDSNDTSFPDITFKMKDGLFSIDVYNEESTYTRKTDN